MKRSVLEHDAMKVLAVLEHGMGGAKLSNEIAAEAGIPRERTDVYMREIARHLNFLGFPVVSDTCGFWIADDPAEVDAYRESLLGRSRALMRRAEKLNEIAATMRKGKA